jgi:ABC-type Mn2+/Zn2+ transport system permease subunit
MNIAKHMETIFLAAIVIIGATGIAGAAVSKYQRTAPEPKVVAVAVEGAPMAVVKVTAKRLTVAQKAAL